MTDAEKACKEFYWLKGMVDDEYQLIDEVAARHNLLGSYIDADTGEIDYEAPWKFRDGDAVRKVFTFKDRSVLYEEALIEFNPVIAEVYVKWP